MASGKILTVLYPEASIPTATVFATPDTIDDNSTIEGFIRVLDFAGATANEHAEWKWTIPDNYAGGGFDYEVHYAMDGTDGSDVQFEVRQIKTVAGDTITAEDLQGATATDITDTPNGTANVFDVSPEGAISHSNAGSPAVGDQARTRLSRDYDHAENADDAQVSMIIVTET